MGITYTSNLSGAIAREMIRHRQRVHEALSDVGSHIAGEAKDRAPVEEGHLTEAISSEVIPHKNSEAALIFVPANHQSAPYAIPRHENDYNLGEGSLAKQSRTGRQVGSKYITRAIDDNRQTIAEIIQDKMELK